MAENPITQFIQDRFITPAVKARLPEVQKDTTSSAMGVIPQPVPPHPPLLAVARSRPPYHS